MTETLTTKRLLGTFADAFHDRGWRDPGYTALDLTNAAATSWPRLVSQRAVARATAQMRVRNGLTQRQVNEVVAPILEMARSRKLVAS